MHIKKEVLDELIKARESLGVREAQSNFGFRHLRVVSPYEVAFREARSAVGAAALLSNAEEYTSVAEAVAGGKPKNPKTIKMLCRSKICITVKPNCATYACDPPPK